MSPEQDSMKDETVLITGANSGVGFETAKALALKGVRIIAACRNREKGKQAVEEIINFSGNEQVSLLEIDLSSLESVRNAAARVLDDVKVLDVLINNAGIITQKRELSEDGFELQLATNHLGPFLLTNMLLPIIIPSSKARIINLSSGAHFMGKIHFHDLMLENSFKPFKAYGQSKLANILFTRSLKHHFGHRGIRANSVHPGFVNTNFGKSRSSEKLHGFLEWFTNFGVSAEKGAETSVWLASSPEAGEYSGEYFVKCKPARTSKGAKDMAAAEKLWHVSEELTELPGLL